MMQFPFSFFSGGRELLPETLAYAAASGATDLVPLNNLFGAVISESLWSNARILPLKSNESAGAGTTIYGAGNLTANNMIADASPDWRIGGMITDGVTYGGSLEIAGLQSKASLTVMIVQANGYATAADNTLINNYRFGFGAGSPTFRALGLNTTTGLLSGESVAVQIDRTGTAGRLGVTPANYQYSQAQKITEAVTFGASGTKIYLNGAEVAFNLSNTVNASTASGPTNTGFATDDILFLLRQRVAGGGLFGLTEYLLVFDTVLTAGQIAAIHAAINLPPAPEIVIWGDSMVQASHSGWTNSAATIRIMPPSVILSANTGQSVLGQGVAGETMSQIATRATASSTFNSAFTVIWGGTNDKDDADASGVADKVQDIIDHIDHERYIVMPPFLKGSWTSTQNNNLTAIRAEYISRFGSHFLDTWTEVGQVTSGFVNTGFRRYQSASTEDDLHPNRAWYELLAPVLKSKIDSLA